MTQWNDSDFPSREGDEFDLLPLWRRAASQFQLGEHSLHGPRHWRAVHYNGMSLCNETGAYVFVVRLFAVLHDSQRFNEVSDPHHGDRAASWAKTLRGELFELDDERFGRLRYALIWHDKGLTSDDPTIGTCWDADRLDLPRVGIPPIARFMSTDAGKKRTKG
jgi:uncharacterized protein